MKKIIKKCKVCPVECNLIISQDTTDPSSYIVEGNSCARGSNYAIKELLEPSRILKSRALLINGPMSRIPVETNGIIPKELVDECMELIKNTKVRAPVSRGDIIIKNLFNTGIDLIASRKVNKLR